MQNGLVDVHAHLTDAKLVGDVLGVLQRAANAGISAILTVGTDIPTSLAAVDLVRGAFCDYKIIEPRKVAHPKILPSLWAAVGVHPHDSKTWDANSLSQLEKLWEDPRVVAIGEIGLDYHYDFSPREVQREVFMAQWALAARLNATAVVHVREAYDDFFALINGLPRPPQVLLHCFSGDDNIARRALDLGFDFSIGGPLTYPKSIHLRNIFSSLPLDRIHLETDCPYLAPQPHRGKVNEPSFLAITFSALAQLRQIEPSILASQLAENARRLFPKMYICPS